MPFKLFLEERHNRSYRGSTDLILFCFNFTHRVRQDNPIAHVCLGLLKKIDHSVLTGNTQQSRKTLILEGKILKLSNEQVCKGKSHFQFIFHWKYLKQHIKKFYKQRLVQVYITKFYQSYSILKDKKIYLKNKHSGTLMVISKLI